MTDISGSPDSDLPAQIARLERRLSRERQARLAAEAIAEKGTRELYQRKERLRLIEQIATAANLDDDPSVAFHMALATICDFTGWPLGHVHMFPDDDANGDLRSSGVWYGDESRFAAFRSATMQLTFPRGSGMPGRVLEIGGPVWCEDVTVDGNFPRAQAARESGLGAAFAFPALIGEEVGAVLEFFQVRPTPPDPQLLETLQQVGALLGRVVERYRDARRLQRQNEELARLYLEAEQQRLAAEEASRAKSAFLAVTSHEVRTPLNAVLGLAEALRRQPLSPGQMDLVEGILDSGGMLLRLLNAVLDLSRIEANRASAELSDFDLAAKLGSIVSIWTPRAREVGVALSLDLREVSQTRIRSDEGRIEQTLVNLVSNALKFSPPGSAVLIRAATADGQLRLEVVDGGPGVPEADRERIFDPFEQTEAGREAGGAGLGLAICQGNVGLLGGRMGVNPATPNGSCFWLELPIEAPGELPSPSPAGADLKPGMRILAAEDNAANRRVLDVLLAPAGAALTFAENGREAVEAALACEFDLILMDVQMPIMDGVEAVRRIRGLGGRAAATPIYMLTANAFAEDVACYLAAGADQVLTKPINVAALYEALAGAPALALTRVA